jgi:hypothetical protein
MTLSLGCSTEWGLTPRLIYGDAQQTGCLGLHPLGAPIAASVGRAAGRPRCRRAGPPRPPLSSPDLGALPLPWAQQVIWGPLWQGLEALRLWLPGVSLTPQDSVLCPLGGPCTIPRASLRGLLPILLSPRSSTCSLCTSLPSLGLSCRRPLVGRA